MKTTKTLMLAGFAALSLGAGVANAQNLTPYANQGAYSVVQSRVAPRVADQVQSGSSDVGQMRPATNYAAPLVLDGLSRAGALGG